MANLGLGQGVRGGAANHRGRWKIPKPQPQPAVKAVSTARAVLAGELRGAQGQRPGSKSPLPEYPRPSSPGDTRGRDVPEVSHRISVLGGVTWH